MSFKKAILPFPKHFNLFHLLTLLLTFFFSSLSAQTPQLDEWKAMLDKTEAVQERFKIMDDIAWESRTLAPAQTIEYGEKIVQIGRKSNNKKWISTGFNRIGIAYKNLDKISTSIVYYDSALAISKSLKDSFGTGRALNQLATLYFEKETYDTARDFAKQSVSHLSLALSEAENSRKRTYSIALATANEVLGNSFMELANFDSSYVYLTKSLQIRQDIGFKAGEAESYLNLSNLYAKRKDDLKLFEYSTRAVTLCDSIGGQDNILAKALNNLGVASFRMNKLEDAETYYRRGLSIRESSGLSQSKKTSYLNLGNLYIIQEKFQEAEKSLLNALNEWLTSGDTDLFLPNANLGHLKLKMGDPTAALTYLDEAYSTMNESNKEIYPEVLKWLADANETLKNTDAALEYRTEYTELKDKMLQKYPYFIRLEDDNERQKNQAALLQKESEKKRIYIYALFGGVILITLLFFTILRISQLRNKNLLGIQKEHQQKQRIQELIKEKELEAINAMVEGQENERVRIARDLHDRLGGTLSIVKMHFKSVEQSIEVLKEKSVKQYKEANNLLDEACDEVRKIAHDMTSSVLMKFGLVAALEALKETVETADQLKLNLIDIGLDDRLSYSYEINIYRIVQELLTNTLKHAGATEMNIQLFRKENSLSIVVDDNGIGFNVEEESITKGIGLKNIESRVYKFDGEINIDSGRGAGTTITIDLPLNKEKL